MWMTPRISAAASSMISPHSADWVRLLDQRLARHLQRPTRKPGIFRLAGKARPRACPRVTAHGRCASRRHAAPRPCRARLSGPRDVCARQSAAKFRKCHRTVLQRWRTPRTSTWAANGRGGSAASPLSSRSDASISSAARRSISWRRPGQRPRRSPPCRWPPRQWLRRPGPTATSRKGQRPSRASRSPGRGPKSGSSVPAHPARQGALS